MTGPRDSAPPRPNTEPGNGLRADSGGYLFHDLDDEALAEILLTPDREPDWAGPAEPDPRGHEDPTRLPYPGVDAKNLAKAGWGVIWADGVSDHTRRALEPLVRYRRKQATRLDPRRYKKLCYSRGDSLGSLFDEVGAKHGMANPDRLPYYLLLVGSPDLMPFDFQHDLDRDYAVGRLDLETPEAYRRYAKSVIDAEKRRLRLPRECSFFAVRNPADRPTRRTAEDLVRPLAEGLASRYRRWSFRTTAGENADRAAFQDELVRRIPPALLFAAGHGVGFDSGDSRQKEEQGALVCSDWPGPETSTLLREHYFTGNDIPSAARIWGTAVFLMACYSAGTPRRDSYAPPWSESAPQNRAPQPLPARLPQRLLAHANGGVAAVMGHVDRAWTTSFSWNEPRQKDVFEHAMGLLLEGYPVGYAMDLFGQSANDLGTQLFQDWPKRRTLSPLDRRRFARRWRAYQDARRFVVAGDPAVKLRARP